MDPISVLRALWNHRLIAFSVFALTAVVGAYVFFFSERSYESVATYALVNPAVPTAVQLEKDPALAALNSDNPYLRSSDNSLAAQVLVSKLNSDRTVEQLKAEGMSTEYAVARSDWSGQGLVLSITADAPSPELSIETTKAIGALLVTELHEMQTVNGADEEYLYTALQVEDTENAREQVSNRLRALIIVGVGGFVLLFGAVSIARAIDNARATKRALEAAKPESPRRRERQEALPEAPRRAKTGRRSTPPALTTLPEPTVHPTPIVPSLTPPESGLRVRRLAATKGRR